MGRNDTASAKKDAQNDEQSLKQKMNIHPTHIRTSNYHNQDRNIK